MQVTPLEQPGSWKLTKRKNPPMCGGCEKTAGRWERTTETNDTEFLCAGCYDVAHPVVDERKSKK